MAYKTVPKFQARIVAKPQANSYDCLKQEIEEIWSDLEACSQAHFDAARRFDVQALRVTCGATTLAALGGVSGIASLPYYASMAHIGLLSSLMNIIASILIGWLTVHRPSQKSEEHRKAGARYQEGRNKARLLVSVNIATEESVKQIRLEAEHLGELQAKLASESPPIPLASYQNTKRSKKMKNAMALK